MNTNLLAIDNIFAGTGGAGPAPAKPTAIKTNKQFSPTSFDNTHPTHARGTETADNTFVNPHNRPNKELPRQFNHALRKEITTKVPQKAVDNRNAQKQNQTRSPAVQPSIVQLWLAQYSQNIEHGKEGFAKKIEPQAGQELAQLLTNSRPDKTHPRAGKTAKPHKNEPLSIIDQSQTRLKAASPNASKIPLAADTPSYEGKNVNRTQTSNTKLFATRDLTNQQSDKGSALKTLVDVHSRITTASKELTITRKLTVPSDQKVPVLNPSPPPAQDKSSGLQSQLVGLGPEKSSLIAEKAGESKTNPAQQGQIFPEPPVDDKASAGPPSLPGTSRLSEPLADYGIAQGENALIKPSSQKSNHPQLQISTSQIKDRGSSVSDNSSNSDFGQILSPNNAQTLVIEESSAFPGALKADNLTVQTSPSDVSASITEQILESINSSSSQQAGTQQITLRLNPPELGKVSIQFEEQERQITGLLEVSRTQTRYEVERALPHIIQNLADCGIQIKRLEVMLTDQSEQQLYRDESLQDGSFQQHHDFPEGGNPDNPSAIDINENESIIKGNDSRYPDILEPQMQITDNSINILI